MKNFPLRALQGVRNKALLHERTKLQRQNQKHQICGFAVGGGAFVEEKTRRSHTIARFLGHVYEFLIFMRISGLVFLI